MDGTVVGIFLCATFLGGLTSGLAGFALGLVVSGIWLHIITDQPSCMLTGQACVILQRTPAFFARVSPVAPRERNGHSSQSRRLAHLRPEA